MSLFQSVILGLVQGITEFLPISSTAHLRIVPALLKWEDPGAFYSSFIQLGTVAAVILYFAKDLYRIISGAVSGLVNRAPLDTFDARLGWYVAFGTLPAAVLGLLFKKHIETTLRSLYVIAFAMIGLALLLFLAERIASHRRTLPDMTMRDGLLIGCAQAVALIPGSSRSGCTLTAGLGLGFKREDAARFSFLLSIPVNVAAAVLEFKRHVHDADRPSNTLLLVGTLVAFVSGMAVIAGLLRFLRTRTTLVFVGYRLAMGVLLLVLLGNGTLKSNTGAEGAGEPAQTEATGIHPAQGTPGARI